MKAIVRFFDRAEDKIRGALSHYPIIYGFLGGIGVVLFWRGVWHISDEANLGSVASVVLGSIILLITGVFVSTFIGNKVIISGLAGEKKFSEKTAEEIREEEHKIDDLKASLDRVEKKLAELESEVKEN